MSVPEGAQKESQGMRGKLKDTPLYNLKVKATHLKHKLGKLENLFNPNHRHDEEHEKETDDLRSNIGKSHRFQSFAPARDGNQVKWYVDGRDYFWAVSVALSEAKETIYIADWWLTPELFMRRPPYEHKEWRLDQILKRKAEEGVKIYINVYKEVEAALTCNSRHTKRALMSLCPEGSKGYGNIVVMRHPDHNVLENFGDMTFYWAHHEKFIVIDYEMAFIGGLDLCFGRWDHHQHPLADVHPYGVETEIFPGQDFNNNRIMDFQTVEDWKSNQLSKAEYGRMPWHDVAMGLRGPCVYDIAEHFVLRWNFCKRDKYKRDERYPWMTLEGRENELENLIGVQRPKFPVGGYVHHPLTPLSTKSKHIDGSQGTVHCQLVRSSADWSSGILTEHSIQNAYCDLIRNAQHYVYIENQFFITATGEHQAPVHNVIGRAIVEAVVRAGKAGRKFRVIINIPAIPGFAGDLRESAANGTRAIMDYQYKSINRGEHSIFGQIKKEGVDPTKHIFVFNLRSYDRLNTTPELVKQEEKSGVPYTEMQRANAEEVMYSAVKGDESSGSPSASDLDSENEDGEKTKKRLKERKKRFEAQREAADVDKGSGGTADTIAHHAMAGKGTVQDEPWPERNQEEKDLEWDNFVQEELYIHAKVLIVDDRHVICGSSNINDRSQLGKHDSELSIVMSDTDFIDSEMDGEKYKAGRHAATLRRYLWREHLGLLPPQDLTPGDERNAYPPYADSPNENYEDYSYEFVADPLSDKVWSMWTENATTNTQIFRDLFHADPDNSIKTFEDYEKFTPNPKEDKSHKQGHLYNRDTSVEQVKKELDRIKGHLVWMPLDFLCDADMAEKGTLTVNQYTESIYT